MTESRRERHRKATYQEILETARQQIKSSGAAALSLRAIAREMRMTAPALYRYFDNRDALVTALIALGYRSLGKALFEALDTITGDDPTIELMAVGMAYRRWGIENPELYTLIFGTPIPGYEAPVELTEPLAQRALGVLIDILDAGARSGKIKLPIQDIHLHPDLVEKLPDPEGSKAAIQMALHLWGFVHGLTSLELFNHYQTLLMDPEELFVSSLNQTLQLLKNKGN